MTLLKFLYALTDSCFPFHLSIFPSQCIFPPRAATLAPERFVGPLLLSVSAEVADAVRGLCSPLLACLSVRSKAKVKERGGKAHARLD